ncbi:MAG: hypothetical protein WCF20_04285 [Methylovirgula sp.]
MRRRVLRRQSSTVHRPAAPPPPNGEQRDPPNAIRAAAHASREGAYRPIAGMNSSPFKEMDSDFDLCRQANAAIAKRIALSIGIIMLPQEPLEMPAFPGHGGHLAFYAHL